LVMAGVVAGEKVAAEVAGCVAPHGVHVVRVAAAGPVIACSLRGFRLLPP
jgi:hypothetical protein